MKSVQNNICTCFLRSIVASALTKNPEECMLFMCFLNTSRDTISNSSFEYPFTLIPSAIKQELRGKSVLVLIFEKEIC